MCVLTNVSELQLISVTGHGINTYVFMGCVRKGCCCRMFDHCRSHIIILRSRSLAYNYSENCQHCRSENASFSVIGIVCSCPRVSFNIIVNLNRNISSMTSRRNPVVTVELKVKVRVHARLYVSDLGYVSKTETR